MNDVYVAPPCNVAFGVSDEIEASNQVTIPLQCNDPTPTPPLSVHFSNDEMRTDCSLNLVSDQTDVHVIPSLPTQNEESELENDDTLSNGFVPTKRAVTVDDIEHAGSSIEISNMIEERERDEVSFPEIIDDSQRQPLEEEAFLLSDEVQVQTLDEINDFVAAQEWDTFPIEPTPAPGIPGASDTVLMQSMLAEDDNENEKGEQAADQYLTPPFPADESMLLWENEFSVCGIGQKRAAPLSTDIVTKAKVRRLE